ncbi:protein tyrosine phosphatase domain-containing protein 1-like [Neocloeon triangulifer]|uniref:protein tyrosine phosphatase domain-containing protein 1-like n=1 Tax=Neocloeon triangulifer TaxID=2078957 RepID=UPI00286ECE4C|nr:protein tyrosine phosphatase domain-containing protein 1-like [Neocloeon triangulifer]
MIAQDKRAPADLQPGSAVAPAAEPNYTKLSENLRKVTPPTFQCSVFCGGRKCKYETSAHWRPEQMAIPGVFSHWVTDDIVAMARPNTELIQKKQLIQHFQKLGINSIINLQLPGEHSSCGNCLEDSGFTYDPSTFMKHNIFFYNFGWKDYGEASLTSLLDMVKVMAFAVSEGKVAVHCHAGLGRTGVLIACYLVYTCRVRANDAIRYVRLKRPSAVQTRGQILCVQEFEQFVLPQCIVFCNKDFLSKDKKVAEFSLVQYLNRQRLILHGNEVRAFKYVPKILFILCERLIKLSGGRTTELDSATPFTRAFIAHRVNPDRHHLGRGGSGDSSNSNSSTCRPSTAEIECDLGVSSGSSSTTCISPDMPSCASGMSGLDDSGVDAVLGDGIVGQKLQENECYQELSSQIDLRQAAAKEDLKGAAGYVADALLADHSKEPLRKQVKQIRIDLNSRYSTVDRLRVECDAQLLAAVLFEWLEHLKIPIITKEELSAVVVRGENLSICLKKFDASAAHTLEYLIRFVARLQGIGRDVQMDLVRRLAASLTHQSVVVRGLLQPTLKEFQKLREGTLKVLINFLMMFLSQMEETGEET